MIIICQFRPGSKLTTVVSLKPLLVKTCTHVSLMSWKFRLRNGCAIARLNTRPDTNIPILSSIQVHLYYKKIYCGISKVTIRSYRSTLGGFLIDRRPILISKLRFSNNNCGTVTWLSFLIRLKNLMTQFQNFTILVSAWPLGKLHHHKS